MTDCFPTIMTPYGSLEPEELAAMLETTVDHILDEFILTPDHPSFFDLSLHT